MSRDKYHSFNNLRNIYEFEPSLKVNGWKKNLNDSPMIRAE